MVFSYRPSLGAITSSLFAAESLRYSVTQRDTGADTCKMQGMPVPATNVVTPTGDLRRELSAVIDPIYGQARLNVAGEAYLELRPWFAETAHG